VKYFGRLNPGFSQNEAHDLGTNESDVERTFVAGGVTLAGFIDGRLQLN